MLIVSAGTEALIPEISHSRPAPLPTGSRLAFRTINHITSLHTLPLRDHEGEGIFRS